MEPDAASHAALSAADWRRGLDALQTTTYAFETLRTASNAFISSCSKASKWRTALSVGVEPDLVTASALLSATAASKLWRCPGRGTKHRTHTHTGYLD